MNPVASALLRPVVFTAGLAVSLLPRALELRLGRALGRLFLAVDPKRRRIAEENMRRCLPELGAAGLARLLRENYEHYGVLALEILHMFSPLPGHYKRYAAANSVIDGAENWQRLNAQGKGVIAVTGHFANWEMIAINSVPGLNVTVTGKRIKPDWLCDKLFASRLSAGGRTATGKRILPELLRWIKDGNTSSFILDQYTAPPAGVPARFFGAVVDTQSVVSLVTQRTGAPILMVYQRRDERGVVHGVFEPLELDEETLADPAKTTQALASAVEAWIRKNPTQWLWVHRRFKNAVWPPQVLAA